LEEVKVLGRGDGEKDAVAGYTNNGGEGVCVVNTLFVATTLGNESGLKVRDVSKVVNSDLVDPHAINDATTRGEIDQRPCVIGL
jgi:hypothetical protein